MQLQQIPNILPWVSGMIRPLSPSLTSVLFSPCVPVTPDLFLSLAHCPNSLPSRALCTYFLVFWELSSYIFSIMLSVIVQIAERSPPERGFPWPSSSSSSMFFLIFNLVFFITVLSKFNLKYLLICFIPLEYNLQQSVHLVYCCIFNTCNSPWYIIDAQEIFVELMKEWNKGNWGLKESQDLLHVSLNNNSNYMNIFLKV